MSEPTAMTAAPDSDRSHDPGSGAASPWVHVAEMRDLARRKRKQVDVAGCPIALFLVDDEVSENRPLRLAVEGGESTGEVVLDI